MPGSRSLTPITEREYEDIEAAVMETARGRWFLSEYARRNRHADTGVLLEAIGRLEALVAGPALPHPSLLGQAHAGEHLGWHSGVEPGEPGVHRLRFDLVEMAKAIARTKLEIGALHPPGHESRLNVASEALDAIVRTTERATSDILEAAERVQEVAWTLRECGTDADVCDELDRRATEIYTACSFQDLTAQRTGRIVATLRFLEARIAAMIEIWDAAAGPREATDPIGDPATRGGPDPVDLSQSDVDVVIGVGADRGHAPTAFAMEPGSESDPAGGPDGPFGARAMMHAPMTLPILEPDDITFLVVPAAEPATGAGPEPLRLPGRAKMPLAEAFATIDALSVEEKLSRFT